MICLSDKKGDEDMIPLIRDRLKEANKKFEKELPKLWETAKKNTQDDKENYRRKNEGK